MEQKLKEIVASFIKIPADQVGSATPIDRSAVQSSILLHRMYARLAEEGLVVENYAAVKVFGDLFRSPAAHVYIEAASDNGGYSGGTKAAGIGVDIEEIAALPRATDFRKEEFYKMNFTPGEMAYCILQPDPVASFAGLFAAKEAMIKADGANRSKAFNTLEIDHSPEGKPLHPDYALSISHAGGMALAVAVSAGLSMTASMPQTIPSLQGGPADKKTSSGAWISWLALFLSAMALLIALFR
ncbi:MAG TPA: 4'-phosphopantetheinyl transferase superfamily protein [Puia sp.]|jgi:phosphopantetheine--protein transferase-like protein|nr:4'-phosphopantetheinyl transferase superfamily protein [Puia sp.]